MLDELGLETTIFLGALIGILVLGISLVVQYFIMKAAVRNGTIEAQDMLQNRSVQVRGNPREAAGKKTPWVCPECKTENPNTVYACENCGYSLR